jgi:hypothetical protein
MSTLKVFCSACDRNVAIVPRSENWVRQLFGISGSASEVTCLEHGVRCTGSLCPFHSVKAERPGGGRADHGAAQTTL